MPSLLWLHDDLISATTLQSHRISHMPGDRALNHVSVVECVLLLSKHDVHRAEPPINCGIKPVGKPVDVGCQAPCSYLHASSCTGRLRHRGRYSVKGVVPIIYRTKRLHHLQLCWPRSFSILRHHRYCYWNVFVRGNGRLQWPRECPSESHLVRCLSFFFDQCFDPVVQYICPGGSKNSADLAVVIPRLFVTFSIIQDLEKIMTLHW